MRSKYWTCTKFANWARGTDKPRAATSQGWQDWEDEAQRAHPVRYWIVEEGFDKLQSFIYAPVDFLRSIKYHATNRWVIRSNALTAHPRDIKPGQWCDVGDRFLLCLFNELVNFVEIELAWAHVAWGDEELRKKYNTPFHAFGWFRSWRWRSPAAGLDHLDWASKLDNSDFLKEGETPQLTDQAINSIEIKKLYIWWTQERPARPDPYEVSGWRALCDQRRENGRMMWQDRSQEERDESKNALDVMHKIEGEYLEEDEQMLIRLIKVRRSLWT